MVLILTPNMKVSVHDDRSRSRARKTPRSCAQIDPIRSERGYSQPNSEFRPRLAYRSHWLKMRNKFNHTSTPMFILRPAQTHSSVDAFGRLTGVFHLSSALS
jgi:hypothetical protein